MSTWDDRLLDLASGTLFVIVLGVPLLGYYFMAVDVHAWWRSLRRALMVISQASHYVLPEWARQQETPYYFRALGVDENSSEQAVRDAYRRLAEALHPDRGGDRDRFLALRRHFDEALRHIQQRQVNDRSRSPGP